MIKKTSKSNRVSTDRLTINGIDYELKRSYAGKSGALEWAAEVRKNGYYPNRRGLAKVLRLENGYWGVFVGHGDRLKNKRCD